MPNLIPHFIHDAYQSRQFSGCLDAVTMFMDISGFTAMTEALMSYGKQGAETLSEILNQVYHPVIHAIYDRGGFVSGFAGDALTAVFPNADPLRACFAAQAIQQTFVREGTRQTPLGGFALGVKIGLASGVVEWGIIGPEGHRACFFRGEAIDGCAQAEHRAGRGEIVLAAALAGLLAPGSRDTVPIDSQHVRLQSIPTTERVPEPMRLPPQQFDTAVQFYPKTILDLEQRGEFRHVVSLFISFQPMELTELDAFASNIIALVDQYGGYLPQFGFGDKGGTVLVFFGAPLSYENNLERALNLALAVREELGVKIRAGIARGITYAGIVGIPLRGEYTCLGNAVNLSARLMMQAGWGEVLVPVSLADQAHFRFEFQGDFAYKGLAEPVPTYRLVGGKTTGGIFFDQPMVGREAELQQLVDLAQPIFEGRLAGAALIYGEAGIGKSHLSYAFSQALGSRVTWLTGQADQILRQPFNPFVHWLKRYFQQSPEVTPEENKARFERKLEQLVRSLGPLEPTSTADARFLAQELDRTRSILGALLDLHWPDSLYEQLDAKLRHENTLFAIKALLLAESRLQPVVFELEDGHWLDEASQELLTVLTRNVADTPLLLLITSRYADDGSRPPFALAPGVPTFTLDLNELARPALRQLAEAILDGPVDDALQALLQEKTQANPFFVQQMLLYFRENDLLERGGKGAWGLKATAFDLPSRINAVLTARIDRLAQQVKEVVQTAAVLGREFEVQVLSQMLQADVLSQVRRAEEAQVWTPLRELRYLFKHALLRDTAYEMQLRARLRELHRLAGQVMEQLYAADLHRYYAALAYHYGQARDKGRERHYARLAGEQAAARFANAEAVVYLSRALELTPGEDLPGRYALTLAREKVYDRMGARDAQRQDLSTLEDLAQALSDPAPHSGQAVPVRAEVALRRSNYAEATSDYPQAIASAQAAVAAAQQSSVLGPDSRQIEARGYLSWGRALFRQGNFEAARSQYQQALSLAQATGSRQMEADSQYDLGTIAGELGDYPAALASLNQVQEIYHQIGDRQGESAVLNTLGRIYRDRGDYAEARDYWERALRIYQEVGDRRGVAVVLGNLGLASRDLGDYAGAQGYLEQALHIRRELGDRDGEGLMSVNLGIGAWSQGNYATAMDYDEQALRIYEEIGNRSGEGLALNNLGIVARDLGRFAQARVYLEKALAIRREIGQRRGQGGTLTNLGLVAWSQGDYAGARFYYEEALRIWREVGSRGGEGITLGNLGLVLHYLGDDETARECSQQALQICRDIGDQRNQGYALIALGHALTGLGRLDEGASAYRQALDIRRELGENNLAMESLAGLARVSLAQGNLAQARIHVEEILHYLEDNTLDGTDEPFLIYLTCYEVLQAGGAPRAQEVLDTAYARLQEQSNRIPDEETRRLFLEKVVAHRRIVTAWKKGPAPCRCERL